MSWLSSTGVLLRYSAWNCLVPHAAMDAFVPHSHGAWLRWTWTLLVWHRHGIVAAPVLAFASTIVFVSALGHVMAHGTAWYRSLLSWLWHCIMYPWSFDLFPLIGIWSCRAIFFDGVLIFSCAAALAFGGHGHFSQHGWTAVGLRSWCLCVPGQSVASELHRACTRCSFHC